MPIVGTFANAEATWKIYPLGNDVGEPVGAGDILVSELGTMPSPHSIYTRQPANFRIPPHYHDNAQFQIFVEGSAAFGSRNIRPLTVHFATHQTGYGPILSGPEGLNYITLRIATEFGAHLVDNPEERTRMNPRIPRRQLTNEIGPLAPGALLEIREPAVVVALDPEPDGLAAWVVRLPPSAILATPRHTGGVGQFHVVTAGSMVVNGQACGRHASVWVGLEDADYVIRSGAQGLEVVICQFPREALLQAWQI
jgi:hypothetical protein